MKLLDAAPRVHNDMPEELVQDVIFPLYLNSRLMREQAQREAREAAERQAMQLAANQQGASQADSGAASNVGYGGIDVLNLTTIAPVDQILAYGL